MRKNVYMFQINYLHGKSTFLPYTVGTLIAQAKSNSFINSNFCFKEPIFIRENTDKALEKLNNPDIVAFSNYIWNYEYNKLLAKKIKEKYPECFVIFGGHQISRDFEILKEEKEIDLLIFGEGEEVFSMVLEAYSGIRNFNCVPNIAYRENGSIIKTQFASFENASYPSPYLTGVFDSILEKYKELDFYAVIETSRGCPYECAYCDWGNLHSKVKLFPLERVIGELRWLSKHNIKGFGAGDANFGMFERDEVITDEIVRLHNEEGVLSAFQTSYAKNSNDRVFSITKKLNACEMNKGVTLSFQTLCPEALENIGRKNISVDTYTSLLSKYNKEGIATYTELILGLPGETYESFVSGVDILLNSGQHNAIYIHNCEWLPCSKMGEKEYCEKYGIETAKILLNQPHRLIEKEEVPEYSEIVVKTDTMTKKDWVKMNMVSMVIQCFHHEGLLMIFALYLHYEKGIKYSRFYYDFWKYCEKSNNSLCGNLLREIKERLQEVSMGEASLLWENKDFGEIEWPVEEYAFLTVAKDIDRFYKETKSFISSYFEDKGLFSDLLTFQKSIIKLPFKNEIDMHCEYDFKKYFSSILCGEEAKLVKKECNYKITSTVKVSSWEDYARYIVWYGRKDSRNIYSDEIEYI